MMPIDAALQYCLLYNTVFYDVISRSSCNMQKGQFDIIIYKVKGRYCYIIS